MARNRSAAAGGSKVRKVFDPQVYEVEIGNGQYDIGPLPIRDLMKFENTLKGIGDIFGDISVGYFVTDGEKDIAGPFDDMEEAQQYLEDHPQKEGQPDLIVRSEWSKGFGDILKSIIATPYEPLSVAIPGLKSEDCEQLTYPEIVWLLELIVEANGIGWFRDFVKNSLVPLIPEMINIGLERFKALLIGSISTKQEMSGEEA